MTREYAVWSSTSFTVTEAISNLVLLVNSRIFTGWHLEGGINIIKSSSDIVPRTEFTASQAMSRLKVND